MGPIIEQKFKESGMTIQQFADAINCDRTTVYDIFKRKSIDSEKLIRISQELNFDFVYEIYYKKESLIKAPEQKNITIAIDEEEWQKLNLHDYAIKIIVKR